MKKLFILILFCCTHFFAAAQWTQLDSGTDKWLRSVFFVNSDTGFAVGFGYGNNTGIVLRTVNGGLTWDSINYDSNQNVYSVSFPSEQVGYICGKGFIKKTTDQGNTWTDVTSYYNYYNYNFDFRQIQFINDSVGYVLDYDGHDFQKTIDGGQTWSVLSYFGFDIEQVYDFYFSSTDTGMTVDFGSSGHEVSVTYDGGVTWTQSLIGQNYYSDVFDCITQIENEKWLAVKDDNGIFADITTDAGQSWTETLMDSVPPQSNASIPFKDVVFPSPNNGWAVGTKYIINSSDGGNSWVVNDSTPDSLFAVFFPNPQVGYAVGSNGLIMKYGGTSCSANFSLVADTLIPHHYWGVNTSTGILPLNYYWSWGDGSYDSIAYPSHIYSDSGFYTICLTIQDSTGCEDNTCSSYQLEKMVSAEERNTIVYVDIVTSIPTHDQNLDTHDDLLFFPNPVKDQLYIKLTATPNEVCIRVYDLQGKAHVIPATFTSNQARLNTSSLIDGFYTFQIINNKTGMIKTGKFEVQK